METALSRERKGSLVNSQIRACSSFGHGKNPRNRQLQACVVVPPSYGDGAFAPAEGQSRPDR